MFISIHVWESHAGQSSGGSNGSTVGGAALISTRPRDCEHDSMHVTVHFNSLGSSYRDYCAL